MLFNILLATSKQAFKDEIDFNVFMLYLLMHLLLHIYIYIEETL